MTKERKTRWERAAETLQRRRGQDVASVCERLESADPLQVATVVGMLERGEFGPLGDRELADLYSAAARALEALAESLRQNGEPS
jgi:hypothetical protein